MPISSAMTTTAIIAISIVLSTAGISETTLLATWFAMSLADGAVGAGVCAGS